MILECSAFTLNMYIVIGFKPITLMKGCVPLDLRCEMIVMPLDRVSRHDTNIIKTRKILIRGENWWNLRIVRCAPKVSNRLGMGRVTSL